MIDYRLLLKKYIVAVGCAEGDSFARSTAISPCFLGKWEYTADECDELAVLFGELDSDDADPPQDDMLVERGEAR